VTLNDIQQLKNEILTSIKQEFSNLTSCIQALDTRLGNLETSFDLFRTMQIKQQSEINELKRTLADLELSKSDFFGRSGGSGTAQEQHRDFWPF